MMFSVLLDVGGFFWVSLTKAVQRSVVEVDTTRAEPL
jgi:hypothetical protein